MESASGLWVSFKLDKEINFMIRQLKMDKQTCSTNKEISYFEFLQDNFLISQIIRQGVPYSFFEHLCQASPFSVNEWAWFLNISLKTLHQNKHSSKRFTPNQSEKIIEISEVLIAGIEVFYDLDNFKCWLITPNFALGSLKPVDLIENSYGKKMVVDELTRISYGIFV